MRRNARDDTESKYDLAEHAAVLKRVEILTEQMAKQQQQIAEMGANFQLVLEQNKILMAQITQKLPQTPKVKVEQPQVKKEQLSSGTVIKTGRLAGKTPPPAPPPPKSASLAKKLFNKTGLNNDQSDSNSDDNELTAADMYEVKNALKVAGEAIPKLDKNDSEKQQLIFVKRFDQYLNAAGLKKPIKKLGKKPTNPADDDYKQKLEAYEKAKAVFVSNKKYKHKLAAARTTLDAKLMNNMTWVVQNLKDNDFMGAWEELQELTKQTGSEQHQQEATDRFTALQFSENMSFLEFASAVEHSQTEVNELHGRKVIDDVMCKSKLKHALKDKEEFAHILAVISATANAKLSFKELKRQLSSFAEKGTAAAAESKPPGIVHNITNVPTCPICKGVHTTKDCPVLAEARKKRKTQDCRDWIRGKCTYEERTARTCGYKHDPSKKGSRTDTASVVKNLVNVVENLQQKIENQEQQRPDSNISKLQDIQKILGANMVTAVNTHRSGNVALTGQPFVPKIHMVKSQHSFTPMPTIKELKGDSETWENAVSRKQKKLRPSQEQKFKGINQEAANMLSNFSLLSVDDDEDLIFDCAASVDCAGSRHKNVKNIRNGEPISMQVASGEISTSTKKGDMKLSPELTQEVRLFDNFKKGIIALGALTRKGYVFAGDDHHLVVVRKADGKKVAEGFLKEDNLYHGKN